ncbi:hypothetical protein Poly59_18610 [Rubripirellula reticaptiva]|uniref:Uncharacterized protein n=1 Tax=Rubripirellula reticaptiva TaxID=2528013 RepID=A0A5C6F7T7_9BACT|nr:hypothetical protein Poly59_18610 [Rubripirellula reticaptiva]
MDFRRAFLLLLLVAIPVSIFDGHYVSGQSVSGSPVYGQPVYGQLARWIDGYKGICFHSVSTSAMGRAGNHTRLSDPQNAVYYRTMIDPTSTRSIRWLFGQQMTDCIELVICATVTCHWASSLEHFGRCSGGGECVQI